MRAPLLICLAFCSFLFLSGCSGPTANPAAGHPTQALESALTELANLAVPAGADPAQFNALKRQLAATLTELHPDGKVVSEPPQDGRSEAVLTWNDGTSTLNWYYYNTGDYNQDGFVTVNDITPLGQNFNVEGPFDPTTAISCVDGNQDDFITVNDITPIGQAFNRSVTGYNIYASSSADDYPAGAGEDNGSATLLGTVEFSAGEGTATERKRFSFTVTSPQAGDNYWVRPSDGTDEGTPSNQAVGGSPVAETPGAVTDIDSDFMVRYDLEVVSGNPAFLYIANGGDADVLNYIRANDELGTDWPASPVTILEGLDNDEARMVVLDDGTPAVFFTLVPDGDTTPRLHYVSAGDTTGATWNTPVIADSVSEDPRYLGEGMITGNPACAFAVRGADAPEDRYGLRFIRASNAAGTSWGDSAYVGTAEDFVIYPYIAEVGVMPAVGYYLNDTNEYRYARATDPSGSAWGTEVTIYDLGSANVGESPSLLYHDDRPMMFYPNPNGGLYLHIADDSDGTSWPTEEVFDGRSGFWPQITAIGDWAEDPLFIVYRNWTNFTRLHILLASNSGSGYAVDSEDTFDLSTGGDVVGWRALSQPKTSPGNNRAFFAYPSNNAGSWSLNLVRMELSTD